MNWIETKNRIPNQETEVLCCLRDNTKKVSYMFFIGGIKENSKWYIYSSDGEVNPEDDRFYISHWKEIDLAPV